MESRRKRKSSQIFKWVCFYTRTIAYTIITR